MDNDNNKMQSVPYVVYESAIATSERAYKRVWSVLIISIIINLLISGLFVWERLQYDYVGDEVHYEQNGDGNNVIGDRNRVNSIESEVDYQDSITETEER